MPRIASFQGLVVKLYFGDHLPPHVHIYAGRIGHPGVQAARFSIDTGELIDGTLPAAKLATTTKLVPATSRGPARRLAARTARPTPDRPLRFNVMEPAIAPEMVAVIARPEHTVRIVFADGEVRDVDITPLLDTPAFSALRDPRMFGQVKVDEQTGTITWPGDVDLDPDVIYAALDLGPNKARIRVLAPSVAA